MLKRFIEISNIIRLVANVKYKHKMSYIDILKHMKQSSWKTIPTCVP